MWQEGKKLQKTLEMNFDMCYPKKKLTVKSTGSWNRNDFIYR